MSLKDYLEGDDLDLSLRGYSTKTLPVKELGRLKKGKKLDLSKNQIMYLPDNFVPTMGHLVKVDLSGNGLLALPDNFGNLSLLQHLDLFDNKLNRLPLSLYKLKALKWLDVKENTELSFPPSDVTGLCRNDTECKACASKVIEFLKKENHSLEVAKQKSLESKRAQKEALKKELERLEELERQEKKRIKQEEKSREKARRKADYERRVKAEQEIQEEVVVTKPKRSSGKESDSYGKSRTVLSIFCAVLIVIGLACLCFDPSVRPKLQTILGRINVALIGITERVYVLISNIDKRLELFSPSIKTACNDLSTHLNTLFEVSYDTYKFSITLLQEQYQALSVYVTKTYMK